MAWLGDGATMHRIPLINILTVCDDASLIVVSTHDCTTHMSAGRKKDTP